MELHAKFSYFKGEWFKNDYIKGCKTRTSMAMYNRCHNPNLGLATKARAYKDARQEGRLGGTPYTPGNARKCEKMNPHTSK
jgi:hypothetical protein